MQRIVFTDERAGTASSQLMEDGVFTLEEENERWLVASRRSCHLVKGVSWFGGRICEWKTPVVISNGNLTVQRYVDDILRPTVLSFF